MLIACIIMYSFGYTLWSIGHNIIQVVYKSYILHTFHASQQDKINLTRTTQSGIAYLLSNGLCFIIMFISFILVKHFDNIIDKNENVVIGIAFCCMMVGFTLLSFVIIIISVICFHKWTKAYEKVEKEGKEA